MLVKQLNNTLKCAYDSDYDKIKKLKAGEFYNCTISQPRNIKFHRKFFALIKMIFDNQEIYKSADRLRKDLLIEAGYVEVWRDFSGAIQREAKSISFAKMSEEEFSELYSRVLDEIVENFNFDRKDIIQNIEQYF